MNSIILPLATTAYSSIISIVKTKKLESLESTQDILMNTNAEFGLLQRLSLTVATLRAYSNPCLVEKMNARNFSNEEKIYLVCLVIVLPIEFIRKYGYRKLSAKEKKAIISYWRHFALKNFNVEVDDKIYNLKEYIREFESVNKGSHPHACHLVKQASEIFIDSLPSVIRKHLRGPVRSMIFSLLDDETSQILGILPSSWLYKALTDCILLGTGLISGFLIPPMKSSEEVSAPIPLLLGNSENTLMYPKNQEKFPRISKRKSRISSKCS